MYCVHKRMKWTSTSSAFGKRRLTTAERTTRRKEIALGKIRAFPRYRDWVRQAPRTVADRQMFLAVLKGLAEVVAGIRGGSFAEQLRARKRLGKRAAHMGFGESHES